MKGEFANRVLKPLLIPIVAAAIIGSLVFSVSRILLAVPEVGSTTIALLLAAEILGVAAVISAGTRIKRAQRTLLLVVGLGLIGGGATSGAAIGVREVEKHAEEIPLAAAGIAFDTDTLDLPAGEPVAIRFANNDPGIPHNVAVYETEEATAAIFAGEIFNGPAARTYELEPIQAGTYFFRCDVHPQQMTGTVRVVGEGGAPSPPPTATASPSVAPSPSPTQTAGGDAPAAASIVARDLQFDKTELILRADAPVTISFDNQDASIEHNVAVYTDESASTTIFREAPFPGPREVEYEFRAPDAGTYFFRCDIHLNMNGSAIFR